MEEPGAPEKKFRFNAKTALFTYPGWWDKEMLKELMESFGDLEEFYAAWEQGEGEGYEHMHVVVKWLKAPDTINQRAFDLFDGEESVAHPHIKTIRGKVQWNNSVRYLAKEDAECAELATYGDDSIRPKDVWACETLEEVYEKYWKRAADTTGLRTLWMDKPFPKVAVREILLRPWQQYVWDLVHEEPDDRSIFFVVDTRGGHGKSTLATYLQEKEPNRVVSEEMGNSRDMSHCLSKYAKTNTMEVILIDCPKSEEFNKEQFKMLEKLKNRAFTTHKYDGGRIRLRKTPHIVVFTNCDLRDTVDSWLTYDRFTGIHLDDKKEEGYWVYPRKCLPTPSS